MRTLYLALGGICVALGAAGVLLPLLPTTPFLLLASFFFVRSSPALDAKLRRSPLFGPLLEDWSRYRGVRLHVKITALSALGLAVTSSLYFGALSFHARIALCVLASIGAVVVLRLRTIRE